MNIAYLCIALLALLLIGAGFFVSLCRNRERIICGYPDDPSHYLHKAVRAHGNTFEYTPMIALLIYVLGELNPPFWVVVCMVLITLARYSVYFGLLLSASIAEPHPLRFIGALGTYILGVILAGYLLVWSVF